VGATAIDAAPSVGGRAALEEERCLRLPRSFMPSVEEEWRRPSSNLPWKMSRHGGLDARRGAEPVRMATTERRIGQEEKSGNFTYWRNVVILSHCATYQT
jgi:hypothetical protein